MEVGLRHRRRTDAIAPKRGAPEWSSKLPPRRAERARKVLGANAERRLQVGRLTMSATTIHFGMLFGDYFLRAGALDSRCIFRLTVRVLKGARDNKPHSKIGDELERAELVVRFRSLETPGAARARPSLVQSIALSRMPAHR